MDARRATISLSRKETDHSDMDFEDDNHQDPSLKPTAARAIPSSSFLKVELDGHSHTHDSDATPIVRPLGGFMSLWADHDGYGQRKRVFSSTSQATITPVSSSSSASSALYIEERGRDLAGRGDRDWTCEPTTPRQVSSFPANIRDVKGKGKFVNTVPSSKIRLRDTSAGKARRKKEGIALLRARVCRAAAEGNLEALLRLLHPEEYPGASSSTSTSNSHSPYPQQGLSDRTQNTTEEDDYPSSFALVNSPTSSGLTPLLEAAQRGHLHIVRHLIEEEGAVRDLEDVEGENAFLKASYSGRFEIMRYLAGEDVSQRVSSPSLLARAWLPSHDVPPALPSASAISPVSTKPDGDTGDEIIKEKLRDEEGTDINCADRQGWTALHNAAGKGYLEIVMWLLDKGADVDVQNAQGYTPLMNAASKGHLPVVSLLLARHAPTPFLRNKYDETAYDVAVSTFELGIAEVLQNYERRCWHYHYHPDHLPNHSHPRRLSNDDDDNLESSGKTKEKSLPPSPPLSSSSAFPSKNAAYNPLALHLTYSIVIFENERLDLRWHARARRAVAQAAPNSSAAFGLQRPAQVAFSAAAISKKDGHASWEMIMPSTSLPHPDAIRANKEEAQDTDQHEDEVEKVCYTPMKMNQVELPTMRHPNTFPTIEANSSGTSAKNPVGNQPKPTASTSYKPSEPDASGLLFYANLDAFDELDAIEEASMNEPAWYFLSPAFHLDLSPSNVDVETGWQYAASFDTPNEEWVAEVPSEVVRLLAGESPSQIKSANKSSATVKWVRRRRWARLVRRRLDAVPWGFADLDNHQEWTRLVEPLSSQDSGDPLQDEDAELQTMFAFSKTKTSADYLERAKYYAGIQNRRKRSSTLSSTYVPDTSSEKESLQAEDANEMDDDDDDDPQSVLSQPTDLENLDLTTARKMSTKFYRAIEELQTGLRVDDHEGRATEAQQLLVTLELRSMSLRAEFPALEVVHAGGSTDLDDADSDSASVSTSSRSASMYSPTTSPVRHIPSSHHRPSISSSSRQSSFALTQGVPSSLANIPVPLNESPVVTTMLRSGSSQSAQPLQRSQVGWEPDESAETCIRCSRKFSFFLRKHHCRRCGRVVCGGCSGHQDFLSSEDVVHEPTSGDVWGVLMTMEGGGFYRTCNPCHQQIAEAARHIDPSFLLNTQNSLACSSSTPPTSSLAYDSSAINLARALQLQHHSYVGSEGRPHGSPMQRSISQASESSELGECPVCGAELAQFVEKSEQEQHLQACFDSGTGSQVQASRYLVFPLPASSPLVGTDCLICFESYEPGDAIGRLSCLCHFHRNCLANWLSRGKACPVHAR